MTAGCGVGGHTAACLCDVDLNLTATVASGATPVEALRQAAEVAAAAGANDVFHQLVEWRVTREEAA